MKESNIKKVNAIVLTTVDGLTTYAAEGQFITIENDWGEFTGIANHIDEDLLELTGPFSTLSLPIKNIVNIKVNEVKQ